MLSQAHHLLSAQIVHMANKVSWAKLCFADGAPAEGSFALSSSPLLLPGRVIEVLGGTTDATSSLFLGIIVAHGVRMREAGASQVVVECRHAATRMTSKRTQRYFHAVTDSDVVTQVLEAHAVAGDVETTTTTHEHLVQYDGTDWDFVVLRAQANGLVVLPRGDRLDVRAPSLAGEPVLELLHGATLLELDLGMDARQQPAKIVGSVWDPAAQAVVESEGDDPDWFEPGTPDSAELAEAIGTGTVDLRHGALPAAEAQVHATGQWRYAAVGRVQGRLMCEGVDNVHPGDLIRVSGVGKRFDGKAYVTGVRHDQSTELGWRTQLQVGTLPRLPVDGEGVTAPRAAGLLPGVVGLQAGVVVGNEDPAGEYRVRVRLPLVDAGDDGTWARVATLDAGNGRGTFFRPEVGDEVIVGFVNGDPRHAIVLGMLHSSAKAAPLRPSDDNHQKGYRSRSGLQLMFDDDGKVIVLSSPAGNTLTISDANGGVSITDQHGNSVVTSSEGLSLESAGSLTLKAATGIVIDAGTSLDLKAGTELAAEGAAGAKLTSSAITVVKGSLVQIN